MSAVKFRADRLQLATLEFADGKAAPALGRANHRRVHQFEDWALAEGVRDDLGAAPLLEEEPLEQIRRADAFPVSEREAEMSDAGFEVLEEAVHQGRPLALVGLDEVVAQGPGQRGRGRFVAGAGADRDLEPLPLGRFATQVAQPMDLMPTSA
jgi:hypothetical protein